MKRAALGSPARSRCSSRSTRCLPRFLNPYYLTILSRIGVAVLAAVSLQLVNGFTGQFSIGHAGLHGDRRLRLGGGERVRRAPAGSPGSWSVLPAAARARRSTSRCRSSRAALAAALAGLVVGIPALRLRGDYLAIATLGFGEIIRIAILNVEAVGGARGFSLAAPELPAVDLRFEGLGAQWAVVALSRRS